MQLSITEKGRYAVAYWPFLQCNTLTSLSAQEKHLVTKRQVFYSGLTLNQDKATKPQTVQIVRQGEATPYWFKGNPYILESVPTTDALEIRIQGRLKTECPLKLNPSTIHTQYLGGRFKKSCYGKSSFCLVWRKRWDSNPRRICTLSGFRVRCIQPLCHVSVE